MKRFFVAHADQYTRRVLEAAIHDLGFESETIQDGLDIIDRVLDGKPEAILLGLGLPGISGLQIARTLRTLQATQQIPILFVTDNAAESTRVLQAALPGVACLQAPFETGRVREQLMRLVSSSTPETAARWPAAPTEALFITDPPTGLFSRAYILHRLAYEGARAARYHHDLAVILLGVRKFNEIVKRRGQRGADAISMDMAGLIRSSIRMVDLVGRISADEFLIILPDTDLNGAQVLAERLCTILEAALFHANGAPERLKVCAGVAAIAPPNLSNNLALYANVETALQRARATSDTHVMTA
jgi:diguanylate cyclase (GGDEF)-like protein